MIINWKGLVFTDISGAEFELTYKTNNKFTVKILKFPSKEGTKTVANSRLKLSSNEFIMTEKIFLKHLNNKNIKIK